MSVEHAHALLEVQLQLELDHQRGVPPLTPRARALQQARASGDQQAQRQALIDLAAACVAMAARLSASAPIDALNELKLRDNPTATPRQRDHRLLTRISGRYLAPGDTDRSTGPCATVPITSIAGTKIRNPTLPLPLRPTQARVCPPVSRTTGSRPKHKHWSSRPYS
jgi:hypothetical protein